MSSPRSSRTWDGSASPPSSGVSGNVNESAASGGPSTPFLLPGLSGVQAAQIHDRGVFSSYSMKILHETKIFRDHDARQRVREGIRRHAAITGTTCPLANGLGDSGRELRSPRARPSSLLRRG